MPGWCLVSALPYACVKKLHFKFFKTPHQHLVYSKTPKRLNDTTALAPLKAFNEVHDLDCWTFLSAGRYPTLGRVKGQGLHFICESICESVCFMMALPLGYWM